MCGNSQGDFFVKYDVGLFGYTEIMTKSANVLTVLLDCEKCIQNTFRTVNYC